MTVALVGYYTITPTHCGTGQAAGAVDLPIAREAHTSHPIFPATSIKGAMRQRFEDSGVSKEEVKRWFGPELGAEGANQGTQGEQSAGSIVFGEGRLLAFPVRALHTAFCYVTCPLIIERFRRDLHAYGRESFWPTDPSIRDGTSPWTDGEALVSAPFPPSQPLVLEDLAFDPGSISSSSSVKDLGDALGRLLPENEKATRNRLSSHLVVLRDEIFTDLVRRTTSVQARIRLNDAKTTTGGGGNLWYEENLPADSLVASFISVRRQTTNSASEKGPADATTFFDRLVGLTQKPLQIGGNETVGQGICLWTRGDDTNG